MSKFPEQLKLKERAEEDIYFARQDRKLIKALREKELAEAVGAREKKQKKLAKSFEKKFKRVTKAHKKKTKKRLKEGVSEASQQDNRGISPERKKGQTK